MEKGAQAGGAHVKHTPFMGRVEEKRGGREAGRVGGSPGLLPTQQLVQMAVEAGPSQALKTQETGHIRSTATGKAPAKNFGRKAS